MHQSLHHTARQPLIDGLNNTSKAESIHMDILQWGDQERLASAILQGWPQSSALPNEPWMLITSAICQASNLTIDKNLPCTPFNIISNKCCIGLSRTLQFLLASVQFPSKRDISTCPFCRSPDWRLSVIAQGQQWKKVRAEIKWPPSAFLPLFLDRRVTFHELKSTFPGSDPLFILSCTCMCFTMIRRTVDHPSLRLLYFTYIADWL